MKIGKLVLLIFVLFLAISAGCKDKKKENQPSEVETAVDALPENIGDKTAPTAIKALRGAEEAKKKMDEVRAEESKVLKEANR